MSETTHKSHKKLYFIVFALLGILTVLELIVPGIEASTMLKGSALCLLAVGKAFLVGYFYMHLNEETKWLKFIALIPISAALYALMVILESTYR